MARTTRPGPVLQVLTAPPETATADLESLDGLAPGSEQHAMRTDLVRLTDACRLALRERDARGGQCAQTLCASSSKSTDVGSLGGCATAPVKQVRSREGAVPPRAHHAD